MEEMTAGAGFNPAPAVISSIAQLSCRKNLSKEHFPLRAQTGSTSMKIPPIQQIFDN